MARTYTTVDDPLGTEGTIAYGINDNGKIVGAYTDNAGLDHGFLLSHGQYTTLDDPLGTEGTVAEGINARGEIVGYYTDGSGINHGFLLNKGQFTTLDDPLGAGGTVAVDITDNGKKIVGYYTDSSGFNHGFLLNKGQYTTIDDPLGAQGTVVEGINDSGKTIVGYYVDSSGIDHVFLTKKRPVHNDRRPSRHKHCGRGHQCAGSGRRILRRQRGCRPRLHLLPRPVQRLWMIPWVRRAPLSRGSPRVVSTLLFGGRPWRATRANANVRP